MGATGLDISVLLPVFNGQRFLKTALESLAGQSHPDYELIIVDDGSTDSTPAILREAAGADSRIRLIRQENQGVVSALNRAIREARAPILARMDADDIAWPRRFEIQLKFLNEHPAFVAIGSAVRIIDSMGSPAQTVPHPNKISDLREAIAATRLMAHPSVMMRTNAVRQVGAYRKSFQGVEDTDLWFRLVTLGTIGNVDETLLDYRSHQGTVTTSAVSLTRIKEFALRGLAFDQLGRRQAGYALSGPVTGTALSFALREIDTKADLRHPWMPDRKVRRILRDLFLVDPSLQPVCRKGLLRLASRQFRTLHPAEGAKSIFYAIRPLRRGPGNE